MAKSARWFVREKLRWGELDKDNGEDLDFLLTPRQVIGPDEESTTMWKETMKQALGG